MRIAIRPPEYFPRLAYMALVQAADRFVLADTFEYSRQSYQNRGCLRNPNGWQWVTVPLQAHQHDRHIHQVRIDTDAPWRGRHWRAFAYNYRSTPYFEYFEDDWRPLFEKEWERLGALTCTTVELLHDLLGLSTPLDRASELEGAPDTLAAVLETVGTDQVLSPAAAVPHDRSAGADVIPFYYESPTYRQNFEGFEPGMSAADVLFNYGPEAKSIIADGVRHERPSTTE